MHDIDEVIERDMCIGCGVCALASGGVRMRRDQFGLPIVDLTGATKEERSTTSQICPFSDESPDEDELAAQRFPDLPNSHELLGRYSTTGAGRISDPDKLAASSSGGLTSWLASRLLEGDHADGIIHVAPGEGGQLFEYVVSEGAGYLDRPKKSNYYATSIDEAISSVRGNGRRYIVIGVPCFIKALRTLAASDAGLDQQVVWTIGLVCGHLKSSGFAESMAWQVGVQPKDLAQVDFRVKLPDRGANDYGFGARARGSEEWSLAPTRSLLGSNWGHAAFQPNACNYCDDIFAETADVTFGDAWLPEYSSDGRGTNVVVSRHGLIDKILADGAGHQEIWLEPLPAERVAASQAGNVRHRRVGLALRLAADLDSHLSVPEKRVAPDGSVGDPRRRRIVELRRDLTRLSHVSFASARRMNDLDRFVVPFGRAVARYNRVDHGRLLRRAFRKLRRAVRS